MKLFMRIFVLVMAVVMLTAAPMQVLAASQVEYICEIKMGYGDDGRDALEDEGFTVWTNLNANEGGNGSAVWLGYKTTTDESKAITDIALMNMDGGYSFDAYTQELENLNRQVSEQLANFEATVEEFRANCENDSPFALQALEVMNAFTDDDTLDASGEPMPVGEILLDEDTPEETLHRIFLEGNSEAISAIESALATACIELDSDNVLARIEEAEYPDELDPEGNIGRTNLKKAFDEFREDASAAKQVYDDANEYEGGMEAFLGRESLSEAERYSLIAQISRYELLEGTDFGDSGMTLLEFALLDDEEENENGEVLEDEYLEMLAKAMTPGQLGIAANVGIMTILVNARAADGAEEAEDMFDEYVELDSQKTISVYYGVDRSLFTDTDSIALTSTALAEKAAAEESSFGKDTGADKSLAIGLTAAAAAAYTISAVALTIGIRELLLTSQDVVRDMAVEIAEEVVVGGEVPTASSISLGGVLTAVGVIAIIAAVVLTIFALLKWIEKPDVPKTIYKQIPRIIVEKTDDNEGFVTYYAAKLAGADEDETDSTALYGDLNGLNDVDQWVALYYTTDPDAGTPLTDEILVSNVNYPNTSKPENYAAVHMFCFNTAANFNQYNTKSGAADIYLFFRKATVENGQTGSVFTADAVVPAVAAFLVGGGIAAAAAYLAAKKKYNTAVHEAK